MEYRAFDLQERQHLDQGVDIDIRRSGQRRQGSAMMVRKCLQKAAFLVSEFDRRHCPGGNISLGEVLMEESSEIHDRLHATGLYEVQDAFARRRKDGARRGIDRCPHLQSVFHRDERSGFLAGFGKEKIIGKPGDEAISLGKRVDIRLLAEPEFGKYQSACSDDLLDIVPFGSLGVPAETSAEHSDCRGLARHGERVAELIHAFGHAGNGDDIIR